MEHLHDYMANDSKQVKQINPLTTLVTERLTYNLVTPNYCFFLAPIRHTVNSLGFQYDSTSFMKELVAGGAKSFSSGQIDDLIRLLKTKVPMQEFKTLSELNIDDP